jgi:hypothetical protein
LGETGPTLREERLPLPLWLIPGLMLLAALGPWPYGYYVLLRLVVCLASIAIAWRLRESNAPVMWALVALAILYNPVVKIALARQVWMVVNVVSVVPFAYAGMRRRPAT